MYFCSLLAAHISDEEHSLSLSSVLFEHSCFDGFISRKHQKLTSTVTLGGGAPTQPSETIDTGIISNNKTRMPSHFGSSGCIWKCVCFL